MRFIAEKTNVLVPKLHACFEDYGAVIDWKNAGSYSLEFEGLYFRRPGPSVALEGEVNDDDFVNAMLKNEVM